MNTLTKERMTEIITDFVKNCDSKQVKICRSSADIDGCEDTWEDNDSEEMKRSLIDNYLLQFGYHTIEEDYHDELSKEELINKYFNQ